MRLAESKSSVALNSVVGHIIHMSLETGASRTIDHAFASMTLPSHLR